ncbi:glutaredoxin family protein [Patescibacteria group bacterium]|nr:glutaredoxin family protein [Patescibacteria group bacterium]MBU4482237.1 glutaredoxin family protein [Patescibacteria group bacterium]
MQPTITIYSTQFCGYCKLAKHFLDENNIAYTDINVGENEEAAKKMIEKSGQQGVPVIIIEKDNKEEILVGFQKSKLSEILNIN